jgi:hypothetical protein
MPKTTSKSSRQTALDKENLRLKKAEANLKEQDTKYRKIEIEVKELEAIKKSMIQKFMISWLKLEHSVVF